MNAGDPDLCDSDSCTEVTLTSSGSCYDLSKPPAKGIKRHVNIELSIQNWASCEVEKVTELPFDINGLKKYQLVSNRQTIMTTTKDGRPWKTWISSSRSGLKGVRRVARCSGSRMCKNENCSYKKQFGSENKLQFQKVDGAVVCFTCGCSPQFVPCPAVKVWEHEKNADYVTVYHSGIHTCIVKKRRVDRQAIRQEIARNPGVKPSKLVNDRMVQLMSVDGVGWEEIELVAEQFVDLKQVHNVRAQLAIESQPDGHNFEAVGKFKTKCYEKDKYLIYRINNRELNCKPSFVFKSSQDMAKLAIEMDKDSGGVLSGEYVYIDAKHDRCRGYKTLTLWVQHPVYRKLLNLAVMDVEAENSENLIQFWQILNEMLQEVTSKND